MSYRTEEEENAQNEKEKRKEKELVLTYIHTTYIHTYTLLCSIIYDLYYCSIPDRNETLWIAPT